MPGMESQIRTKNCRAGGSKQEQQWQKGPNADSLLTHLFTVQPVKLLNGVLDLCEVSIADLQVGDGQAPVVRQRDLCSTTPLHQCLVTAASLFILYKMDMMIIMVLMNVIITMVIMIIIIIFI